MASPGWARRFCKPKCITKFAFRATSQAGETRTRGSEVPAAPPPPPTRRPPQSDVNRKKGGAARRHRYTTLQKSEMLSFHHRSYLRHENRPQGMTPLQHTAAKFGVPHGRAVQVHPRLTPG